MDGGDEDSAYADAVLSDSPSAFYRFEEASGTTAADSSGNGHDGIYAGSPTLGRWSLVANETTRHSAEFFNGYAGNGSQRMTVSYGSWMNTAELTVTFVYMCTSTQSIRMIASRYGSDANPNLGAWFVDVGANDTLTFYYRTRTASDVIIDSGIAPVVGGRYYIAAYVNATESGIRVYGADGALLGSQTGVGGQVYTPSTEMRLFDSVQAGYSGNGYMDDFALFDHSLTTSRLDTLAALAMTRSIPWTARSSGVLTHNGTTAHTIPFTPAQAGSLLVAVASCPDESTAVTSGWTRQLSTVYDSALDVFTHTASAGDALLQISHTGSNFPLHYVVYEFPAGSSWCTSATTTFSTTYPDLTGLPGTPVAVFAAMSMRRIAADNPGGATLSWRYFWNTDFNQETLHNGVTNGVFTNIGYIGDLRDTTASVYAPDTQFTDTNASNAQKALFAIAPP